MPAIRPLRTRRGLSLEGGLTRAASLRVRGRTLHVLAWRLAIGWGGTRGIVARWVLPVALGDRRDGRVRWRLVPDLTLALSALTALLAMWIVFGPQGRGPELGRARLGGGRIYG